MLRAPPPRSTHRRLGLAPRTRQLLSDYLELTKPKVQSLLLLTTIATMYVAGDPSPLLVALTCLGGYLSAGGAGAVNHWFDRDIDARMARTAERPVPSGRVSPRAALAFGCTLAGAVAAGAVARRQPAGGRAVLLGLPRLRVRLHGLAEAAHAAEHRHRRRRRRRPAARRLGRGDRLGQRHRGDPVLHRLLLDAAALLGAVAADEGRVREGRRADAAGRARRGRDAPADPALLGAALRGHPASLLRGRLRRRSTSSPRLVLGLGFIAGAVRLYRRADRRSALQLYLFSLAYLALLFCAMVADAHL